MADIKPSQLKFVSMGTVANNKPLSSDMIEVTPIEHLQFLDGQLTDNGTTVTASGVAVDGTAYNTQVATSNTLKAKWLKMGNGNRTTAPDIRRGATVAIYQFADVDAYWWATLLDDSNLRKLETVIWAFSGTSDESAANDHTNSYYLEVSTHSGLIAFHTSKSNNEPYSYDIQLNTQKGSLQIQDDIGNYLLLDSTQNKWEMGNGDQSLLQMLKDKLSMTTTAAIAMKTKAFTLDVQTAVITAVGGTTHNGNFTERGAFALAGDMVTAANDTEYGDTGTGKVTIKGDASLEGSLGVTGDMKATTIEATESITAPNLKYT